MLKIKSLPKGTYRRPKGRTIINFLEGVKAGLPQTLGNSDLSVSANPTVEELKTSEHSILTNGIAETSEINPELKLVCRQKSGRVKMMEAMGDGVIAAQAPAIGLTKTFENFAGDEDFYFETRRMRNVVPTDEFDTAYIENEHYTIQTDGHGLSVISMLGKPNGAGDNITFTFDQAASNAVRIDLFTKTSFEATVAFIEDSEDGVGDTYVFHRVAFTSDGERVLSNNQAGYAESSFTGKILPDPTKPQLFGYMITEEKPGA